ncbi:MAG: methyltransferase domain-containing protein [Sphingomonadaceae bacterium]|nr:methyltransferase domain-containing protein [Sphingomonadaceae bacterium]
MRYLLVAAALLCAAAPAAAQMSPTAAVADQQRPAEDRALDAGRKPAEVLAMMGLKPGMAVLDLVAGSGYYSELIADVVGPKGEVVATNPAGLASRYAEMWKARVARHPNITPVQRTGQETSTPPANRFDAAMMHLIYHDFYWESAQFNIPRIDPQQILGRLYAELKPGGTVLVVDHVANPGGDTRKVVNELHRIDPATIRADFERAGFKLAGTSNILRVSSDDHTKLVFDKSVRGNTDRVIYRFVKP